jgi:hypothetical protein
MIIWEGRGFLVAVIAFACLLASEFLTERYFADDRYYQQHGWPKLVGFFVAGVIVWGLSMVWKDRLGRAAVDKHSLFFIPFQYWGFVLFALGVVFLFVRD